MSVINTNVNAIIAQNAGVKNERLQTTAMQRLSTGNRINTASDDAAGLAISTKMTSQIRGLNQAVRNANDGISLIQTAEGALTEVNNMLQRMRELAIQSASDTNTTSDRTSLNAEFVALRDEINRIGNNTQFNGMNVLDASFVGNGAANAGKFIFQVGANAAQTIDVTVGDYRTSSQSAGTVTASATTANAAAVAQVDQIAINTSGLAVGDTISGEVAGRSYTLTLTLADLNSPGTLATSLKTAINDSLAVATAITSVAATTDSNNNVILTASAAGTGFTAATSSVTAATTGTASASTTTAAASGTAQVDTIDLSAGYAGFAIDDVISGTVDGTSYTHTVSAADFASATALGTNLATSINNALTEAGKNGSIVAAVDANGDVTLTEQATAGDGFTAATSSVTAATTGTATASTTTSNAAATAQVDTIALSGSYKAGDVISFSAAGVSSTYTVTGSEADNAAIATAIQGSLTGLTGAAATVSGDNVVVTASSAGTAFTSATSSITRTTNTGGLSAIDTSDIESQSAANSAVTNVDAAIAVVSGGRATMGATINRLNYAADNLMATSANVSASRSRIQDTDYSQATTELARTQIIQQASTAMLAQANQSAQSVLSLLK